MPIAVETIHNRFHKKSNSRKNTVNYSGNEFEADFLGTSFDPIIFCNNN